MPFSAVLLDLDGTLLNTLLNTLPDLADATNAMRTELGLPPLPQDVIVTYVGKGMRHLVQRALHHQLDTPPDDATIEHGLEVFQHCYHLINGDKVLLYPGVLEGLTAFRDQGLPMAIVTNKPYDFTLPLLERTGLSGFFAHLVCGDTCEQRKPHPMPLLHACTLLGVAPEQALVIGDSSNDALAARAAGITVLAVPYGYNEGHDIHSLDVDAIVSSIEDAAHWARTH